MTANLRPKGNNNPTGKSWNPESRRKLERPSLLLGEAEPMVTRNPKAHELRVADPNKPKRESTGDMLFIRDRPKYEAIVHMLAANETTYEIHKQTKVDRTVIEAVRAREKIPIETERAYILETVRKGARLYAERMVDLVLSGEKIRPRDVTIGLGVLTDKMLLLSGEATSISQQTVTHNITHAAFNDILDAIDITPDKDAAEPSNGQQGPLQLQDGISP